MVPMDMPSLPSAAIRSKTWPCGLRTTAGYDVSRSRPSMSAALRVTERHVAMRFPVSHLAGFRGFLQADAYAGYDGLYRGGVTEV